MAINQGSILDHVYMPAIHPDDAVYQSLTPTSNGKVAVTVNGVSTTDFVHARGLIKAAGHADNYLALKDGLKSGQEVYIQETGDTKDTPLFIRNQDGNMLAVITPGETAHLRWYWISTSSGAWHLLNSQYAPTKRYLFQELPLIHQNDGTVASGTDTEINVLHFPDGLNMQFRVEATQTLLIPVANASGIDFAYDQANNDGWYWQLADATTSGLTGISKFTVGGPSFFCSMKFSVANASGSDGLHFGFRKIQAMVDAALITTYTDYSAIGWNGTDAAQNVDIMTEVNGANANATDSLVDFSDTNTKTFKCLVSDAGVMSWTIDGTEPTVPTSNITFDDADELTVGMLCVQASSDQTGAIVLQELEVGYQ